MKKLLQLTLIISALLFTFSCDSDESTTDPSSELSQTWVVRHINAYSDAGCSQLAWNYSATTGEIDAPLAADCHNLETFFAVAADDAPDGAHFTADDFCASTDDLSISMYLQMRQKVDCNSLYH